MEKTRPPKPTTVVVQTPPLFLDRADAATALGKISESKLAALVASKELKPPRKIGDGRVGWLWEELQEFARTRPVSDLRPDDGANPCGG